MPIQQLSVGDARVAIIDLGELQFDLDSALTAPPAERSPEHAKLFAQPVRVPINCIYIEIGDTSILVDAGRNDLPPGSPFAIPGYQPPPGLAAQLASIHIAPATIDHVVITHLHFDHYNGLLDDADGLLFPNAIHHISHHDWHRTAFQEAAARPDSLESKLANALDGSDHLHQVEGEYELTDGVTIIPTPGETEGHQAVRVESGGDVLYCVGDLYHHPLEVSHPGWMTHWADPESNHASKERISRASLAENALIIATHIAGAGRLKETDTGVRWQA